MDTNWLWITLVLPVLIGFFKNEISSLIGDYMVYKNRAFDEDGDPGTGEPCYIQSSATGQYVKVLVAEYQFGLAPSKRRVITHQKSPEGNIDKIIVVPYSYSAWAGMVKGSMPKPRTDFGVKL